MPSGVPSRRPPPPPGLILVLTAPIPLILLAFFFCRWYQQRNEFIHVRSQFMQRQNSILGNDAREVAQGVRTLLEKAARDVQVVALLPKTEEAIKKFYWAQGGEFTHFDATTSTATLAPLLFYNRILFLREDGKIPIHLYKGRTEGAVGALADCHEKDLCDRRLLEHGLKLPVGEIEFGGVLRWYSPKGTLEHDEGASLGIVNRTPEGVYFLGIDYRHLRDFLTHPTFPYSPKRNLLAAYEAGTYIYILDSQTNIIAHPKPWHVIGVDAETGHPTAPLQTDNQEGTRPINVAAYEQGKLKKYFDRLLKVSFPQKRVDVFEAVNLNGKSRVVSLAPIEIGKGQFRHSGVFGYVIVGCALDYFEEPREKIVAFY